MENEEVTIDIESLRRDLINYFEGAYFAGGFGAAIIDIGDVQSASPQELIIIAQRNGFDLNDYVVKQFHV